MQREKRHIYILFCVNINIWLKRKIPDGIGDLLSLCMLNIATNFYCACHLVDHENHEMH